jgi:hypothetical protein
MASNAAWLIATQAAGMVSGRPTGRADAVEPPERPSSPDAPTGSQSTRSDPPQLAVNRAISTPAQDRVRWPLQRAASCRARTPAKPSNRATRRPGSGRQRHRQAGAPAGRPQGMATGGPTAPRKAGRPRPTRQALQTPHRPGIWQSSPVQRIGRSRGQPGCPGASRVFSSPECSPER